MGYTGSGKTSLINFIPRLYDVTSGEIFIDGNNVKDIPLDVLRTNVAVVQQESFLFSDSVYGNIILRITRNQINKELKKFLVLQILIKMLNLFQMDMILLLAKEELHFPADRNKEHLLQEHLLLILKY